MTCPLEGNVHVHILQIKYLKALFVTFHEQLCRFLPDVAPVREVGVFIIISFLEHLGFTTLY